MKLALGQLNPTIGDVRGNTERIIDAIRRAADAGADLAVFPEQAVIGYPAKDLLLRRELIQANVEALDRIAAATDRTAALVGFAEPNDGDHGRPLYNSAALLAGGRRVHTWRKRLLPTYDVFDEDRYFQPAASQDVIEFAGCKIGVSICEDLLSEKMLGRPLYACDPIDDLAGRGAELLINISASPYVLNKHAWRSELIARRAREVRLPLVYVNQVGGNDHLIFDGASCAFDATGERIAQARSFEEDLLVLDPLAGAPARLETVPANVAALHDALVLGVRDYLRKCGFRSAVVGVSGGIDSAVVCALAVTALGAENVRAVAMPSRYSSDHSLSDAEALTRNLGLEMDTIAIEPMHAAFEQALAPMFEGRTPDVTEENIQARVRGALLMAVSNKFGGLLLTTGNKSELAVGYCTLYGDMCGGLAVISDVPKTMVFALARHINERAGREVIPENVLTKPPSAELRPDQFDQQSLPEYATLDAILERYEERLESPEQIVAAGYDAAIVAKVIRLIQLSEYKRQQAAVGLKVTSRAFGFGRRMPIAARAL